MSKAEKFIIDYTKNCSNAIYDPYDTGDAITIYAPWLTPDQARRAVEIAREEIFEKMRFYIESMVSDITFSDVDGNDNYNIDEFIEDFKKYMKGE